MAHLDYTADFEDGRVGALLLTAWQVLADWVQARKAAHALRAQQRLDRRAFETLMGKEEWILRDMGVDRADIERLVHSPLHINAARELEKLRATSRMGR